MAKLKNNGGSKSKEEGDPVDESKIITKEIVNDLTNNAVRISDRRTNAKLQDINEIYKKRMINNEHLPIKK